MINKIILAISVVILALLAFLALRPMVGSEVNGTGTAGGLLIENYIPAILYNDGYKSEREIVLSGANGDITTGDDLTVTDDLIISGGSINNTTTNTATSSFIGGCDQRYPTSTLTSIVLAYTSSYSSTTTFPTGTNVDGATGGLVAWNFGSCPL
jgi:hypothetical protein